MDKLSSIDELLQKIELRPPDSNSWMVLVAVPDDIQSTIDELQDSVEIFSECEAVTISGEYGSRNLVKCIKESPQEYFLLHQFDSWDNNEWEIFDTFRTQLDKNKNGGLVVLSEQSSRLMFSNAPHFVSFVGSRIYYLDQDADILTSEECEQRLSALQEWSGQTNEEIIALAENRQLPTDPEYGEWLILLDRGDLLERQK
ncbi:ABC transporter permease [Pseudanabaena biceps]|uniref:ABC transporter permease n=1 Tax=Pseudanabaena biceps TaxID=927669 RepID=UPI000C20F817|nr:ABC transporter permease [Pseudanabaena biceps]TYQ26060.1 ABC transporter permease [Pseudanabaena sp. UWO310]